jgi:hypothetical protein
MLQEKELNGAEILLIKALNNVDRRYLKMRYDKIKGGFQKPERVFNAELYHQLRKIQEKITTYQEFSIHQEITKHKLHFHLDLVKLPRLEENHPCIGDYSPRKISPDIVFHGGQNNTDKQLLVAEIKMEETSWVNIIKDFQKLLFYKLSRLKFQNAVFIYSGIKEDLEAILFTLPLPFLECLQNNKIIIVLPLTNNEQNYEWKAYQINLENHI